MYENITTFQEFLAKFPANLVHLSPNPAQFPAKSMKFSCNLQCDSRKFSTKFQDECQLF